MKLAASRIFSNEREIQIGIGECQLLASALDHFDEIDETNVVSVFEVKKEVDWRQPLIEYIQYDILPNDPKKRTYVKCLKMTLYIKKLSMGVT